jgi:hypothetical protein
VFSSLFILLFSGEMEVDMSSDNIGGYIIALIIAIPVIIIAIFLIFREYVCWYSKVNARLHELRQLNQTMLEIRALLVQGNTVGAITAGGVMDIAQAPAVAAESASVSAFSVDEELPEL